MTRSDSTLQKIIIDNGSGTIKCGVAGEDLPLAIFPNVIARPKYKQAMVGLRVQDLYIGDEAQQIRGAMTMEYPLEHGIISNWEGIVKIWEYALVKKIGVNPSQCHIFITEAALNPKGNREQTLRILFEAFGAKGSFIAVQAVLGLYASGRTSGFAIDSGDGVTHFVPVYEGYIISDAIKRRNFAGRDLTRHMYNLLNLEQHDLFSTSSDQEVVREIKERVCYVALDYEHELGEFQSEMKKFQQHYELPDGNILLIGDSAIKCPEALFR